jgi:hypothetical protein
MMRGHKAFHEQLNVHGRRESLLLSKPIGGRLVVRFVSPRGRGDSARRFRCRQFPERGEHGEKKVLRETRSRLGGGCCGCVRSAGGPQPGRVAPPPQGRRGAQRERDHRPVNGPLANTTVSFGQWRTDPPLDRYPYPQPLGPPPGNVHLVIPHEATIKVGGTVSFIIGGVHQIIVYAPGTRPEDVNTALTRPAQGGVRPSSTTR